MTFELAAAPSARLLAVAELVPEGSRVADVGSGHGLLARWLVDSGRAAFCVATERDPTRLLRVEGLPEAHPLRARLKLRDGDGLAALLPSDEVDVVVLAGLGGPSIRRILADGRLDSLGASRFVLQPQTEAGSLRAFLVGAGMRICDERLARTGERYYPVIAAERGNEIPSHPTLSLPDLLEVGPRLLESPGPHLAPYWEREAVRLRDILSRARAGKGRLLAERRLARAGRILAAISGSAGRTPPSSDRRGSSPPTR